jgi:hypothetical protein
VSLRKVARSAGTRLKKFDTRPGAKVSSTSVPECPPGYLTGPPDFVGVGAQRSGTSWWFEQIVSHPQAQRVPDGRKEVHFFDDYWKRSFGSEEVAKYHAQFPRRPGSLVGEWTPRYMHDLWVPPLLAQSAPDARFLVLLRDPVARFISGIARDLEVARGLIPSIIDDAVTRGRYHYELTRFLSYVPRERVLVMQFEECVARPVDMYKRTLDFIGFDDVAFVPPALEQPVIVGGLKKRAVADHLIDRIIEELGSDVANLACDFEIDLSLWRYFAS